MSVRQGWERSGGRGLRSLAVAASALAALSMLGAGAAAAPGADGSIGGLKAKFVDVNGVKARYYEAGKGEPMVLIHGGSVAGSSTANVWSRNVPALAKQFHVYAIDRLGCGLTGNPAKWEDLDTPGQVEFVYQFIQTLKLGPLHLVGHSAGGGIAFYLATEHPEIVKTLTIVAHGPANPRDVDLGPMRLEPELKKCPDQNVYEGLRCRVEKLAWLPTTFDQEYWDADRFMAMQDKSKAARAAMVKMGADKTRAEQNAAYRQKAWDRAKSGALQMPVFMYAGKQDVLDWSVNEPTAGLRGELALYDIIGAKNQKVQLVIINEGGHFMYREHPEQFNNKLMNFIDFWSGPARTTK